MPETLDPSVYQPTVPDQAFPPDPAANVPTSAGAMYMTPTPRPPLSPDQQVALQSHLVELGAAQPYLRAPVAPPTGTMGGVSAPDMGAAYRAAFSRLPVDQAAKAVEAAVQYQGVRGYQRDLAQGMPAAQAFAKWGPMLFHRNATGMTTAMRLSQPQTMTPAQQAASEVSRRRLALQEAAAVPKPRLHVGAAGEVIRTNPDATFEVLRPGATRPPTVSVPLDPDNPTGAKITGPANDPDVRAAMQKLQGGEPQGGKTLTREQAKKFMSQAGGDRAKARKLARDAGYSF